MASQNWTGMGMSCEMGRKHTSVQPRPTGWRAVEFGHSVLNCVGEDSVGLGHPNYGGVGCRPSRMPRAIEPSPTFIASGEPQQLSSRRSEKKPSEIRTCPWRIRLSSESDH